MLYLLLCFLLDLDSPGYPSISLLLGGEGSSLQMNSFCDWTEVELQAFQAVHGIMRESGTQECGERSVLWIIGSFS